MHYTCVPSLPSVICQYTPAFHVSLPSILFTVLYSCSPSGMKLSHSPIHNHHKLCAYMQLPNGKPLMSIEFYGIRMWGGGIAQKEQKTTDPQTRRSIATPRRVKETTPTIPCALTPSTKFMLLVSTASQ